MARRGGKAASRRARQKRRSRPAAPPPVAPRVAPQPAEAPLEAPPPERAARQPISPVVGSSSRLGEAAAAEYHYVVRDLRNIAVLVVVMAVVLGAVTVAVNLAGIAPR